MAPPDAAAEKGIHLGEVGGDVELQAGGDIIGGDRIAGDNVAGNKIVNITTIAAAERVTHRPLISHSPYRGLEHFVDQNRDLFFGRDGLIDNLLAKVESSSLVLVLGASGSGKSSLVRAGLLPHFAQRHRGRYIALVPNQNPFKALESGLINAGHSQASAARVLEATPEAVASALASQRDPIALLFIDQFEELFTQTEEALREPFVAALLAITRQPAPLVRVVLAMRADFLDRLSPFSAFAQAIEANIQLVTDMRATELRQAIEQPAARHGVVFEPGLVDEIVSDLKGQAGCLPLLQYTLDVFWAAEQQAQGLKDRTLHGATYHGLGGVRGALEKRANQIYDALGTAVDPSSGLSQQQLMRQIFLRLVDVTLTDAVDAGACPVRRRVPKASFARPAEQLLLDTLINQKLLVSSRDASSTSVARVAVATVEVAHEALFACWARLAAWVTDARHLIFVKNRLSDDVLRWLRVQQAGGSADDELRSGVCLDEALELRAGGDFEAVVGGLSPVEEQFLEASASARDGRRKAERVRRQTAFAVLGAFLLAALVGLAHSNQLREKAEQAKRDADASAALAIEQGMLAKRESNANVARQLSRQSELAFGPSVKDLLQSTRYAIESLTHTWTFDAHQLLMNRLRLLPPAPRVSWRAPSSVAALAVSSDGHRAATGSPGEVVIWSLEAGHEGQLVQRLGSQDEPLTPDAKNLTYSRDGRWLAVGCHPKVCIFGTSDDSLRTIDVGPEQVLALDLSPNGRFLAVGRYAASTLFSVPDGRRVAELPIESRHVLGIAFAPNGKHLATASPEGIRLFDVSVNGAPSNGRLLPGNNFGVGFAPNGERLGAASWWGMTTWTLEGSAPSVQLDVKAPLQAVSTSVVFSPSGDHLLVSPSTHVWDVRRKAGGEVLRFMDEAPIARFADPSSLIWTAHDMVFIAPIESARGELVRLPHEVPARGVDFSDDAQRLATCDGRGVNLFDLTHGSWTRVAQAPVGGGGAGVRISPDGRLAASWNQLQLTLLEEGRQHPPSDWHGEDSTWIDDTLFSADGALLAIARGSEVGLLRTAAPYQRIELPAHRHPVSRMGFSPDGKALATFTSASCSHGILSRPSLTSVFDVSTGERRAWRSNENEDAQTSGCGRGRQLEDDSSVGQDGDAALAVEAAHWLLDFKGTSETRGHWAIHNSGSAVTVTDLESERELDLVRHDGPVTDIDLSPDGRWLATASDDSTVRLWALQAHDLVKQGCTRLPVETAGYGQPAPICPPTSTAP